MKLIGMLAGIIAGAFVAARGAPPAGDFSPVGAREIIGARAYDASGESAGEVRDLLVDLTAGRIAYVIVAGADGQYSPVPPDLVERGSKGRVLIHVQSGVLEQAPHFSKERWAELSSAEQSEKFYHYYGTEPIPGGGRFRTGQSTAAPARGRVDMIGYGKLSKASELLGMKITNYGSESVGNLRDLVLNLSRGEIAYAAVASSHKAAHGKLVAVPPQLIQRHTDAKSLILNVEREKLAKAPVLDPKHWPQIANPAWGAEAPVR